MERRYRETESTHVREELSKYLSSQSCPDCAGTRLKRDARFVLIQGSDLPTITSMTVAQSHEYFCKLKLKGKSAKIAEKVLKNCKTDSSFLSTLDLTI